MLHLIKVKQSIVVKIRSWPYVVVEIFQFFYPTVIQVWKIVRAIVIMFFFYKVWICYEFLKCSMHHGPIESVDYLGTNKIWIHHAHFANLR